MTLSPRRILAAVLVTAAGAAVLTALPAQAHNARDTPRGAPRMDLEVMVTPEIEGRITPGGTDPIVSVDTFGNRFIVARKEDAQRGVGIDPRSRTASRASAWAWTSADHGLTWTNLDILPRGAEQLVPESLGRDVASNGPLTYIVENYGATSVVHVVKASGLGRLGTAASVTTNPIPGTVGGDVGVATNGQVGMVSAAPRSGPSVLSQVRWGEAASSVETTLPGRCDVAADPRPAGRAFWAACVEGTNVVLHQSRDAGATFARRAAMPSRGDRAQVDVGPDGTPYVLSGGRLSRLVGARVLPMELRLPAGEMRGAAFAVSNRGRVAASIYHRARAGAPWTVQVALFTPGTRPVWYSFADHDPADSGDAATPPSEFTSVDTDPFGRLQLAWATTFLSTSVLDVNGERARLRNVFTARSVTS
jgi:hypothetical protein